MKKVLLSMLALGMSVSMFGATIYLNTGGNSLWNQSNATFKESISGQAMTKVDGTADYFSVEIESTQTQVHFQRLSPEGSVWNETSDLTIESGKDCFTITGWNSPWGEWSVYTKPAPYFALHGNFTGTWGTSPFSISDDETTATLTISMKAGEYEFGARINGEANWTSNGLTVTRDQNSVNFNTTGSGNNKLTADIDGDYTFTYTFATNILVVTYPSGGTTALQAVTVADIYANNGRIYGAEGMRIYTVSGMDVTNQNGQLNGIYVVKTQAGIVKVVVR
ncbi:MAG: hypothetical protein ACI30H_01830 [Paludibacteraceae bacterium]